MKKEKSLLNRIFTKKGNLYKVFWVDDSIGIVKFQNLSKPEIINQETIDKFLKNYKEVK
jgi:hypothetical protein